MLITKIYLLLNFVFFCRFAFGTCGRVNWCKIMPPPILVMFCFCEREPWQVLGRKWLARKWLGTAVAFNLCLNGLDADDEELYSKSSLLKWSLHNLLCCVCCQPSLLIFSTHNDFNRELLGNWWNDFPLVCLLRHPGAEQNTILRPCALCLHPVKI